MANHSIVFLMYHELELPGRSICQDEPGYARYVLADSEFRSQMKLLKTQGWRGLSVGEALSFPDSSSVAITFDDGCETDLIAAAPILRDAGFNATFFITTGRLNSRGYLSRTQLQELSSMTFEIGCHSMTHPYLPDLDHNGLQREIVQAKADLEQIIGKPVEHFSCPGGRYDRRVIDIARAARYRSICTSRVHANSKNTDLFSLGRIAMLRGLSLPTFTHICDGTSLAGMRVKSTLCDAAKRILGNSAYDRLRAAMLKERDAQR